MNLQWVSPQVSFKITEYPVISNLTTTGATYCSLYTTRPATQLNTNQPSSIIMPAQQNAYHSITSSGSFVMRASLHNRDCFSSARDDLSRPYPSYEDVYLRSNTSNPGLDEFQDLGLNNFLVTQRRVVSGPLYPVLST